MRAERLRYAVIAAAGWLLLPGFAAAADNEAGVPLAPSDAAGPWTLESGGGSLCTLTLSSQKAGGAGYGVSVPASCGDVLPPATAGWTPTGDGMSLNGADGTVLIAFNRWSNSLFVSHRASGTDLQLKRGGPGPLPAAN
jgi:hypothetical protein